MDEGGFYVPDPTFQEGEQGTLIPEEEYGTAEAQETEQEQVGRPQRPKKEKKEKKARKPADPNRPTMRWLKDIGSKFKTGVLQFYDEMTREEEEMPAKGVETQKKEEK